MIEVRFREIAKLRGIKNSYQLEQATGWSPGHAARIWNGPWKRVDLKTLNTLCNALKCTPDELLSFTPDRSSDS